MYKAVRNAALSLVIIGLCGSAGEAQQQQQPRTATGKPYQAPKPQYNQIRHEKALETTKLNEKVELDYLPDFTGKQLFIDGTCHERIDGPTYIQHFQAEATAEQVIDWYKNVLASNKWQITCANDREHILSAKREGNTVSLIVNAVRIPKFNSSYEISYFALRKR